MSPLRAPTARRRPISARRWETDISMMFMITTPPTSSATPETASRSAESVDDCAVAASFTSSGSRTKKSSSPPAAIRWRSRSSARISSAVSLSVPTSRTWTTICSR